MSTGFDIEGTTGPRFASAASGLYRFACFEVDFRTRELRKSGLRIHTQDQPLQVLAILLRHPGQIVTRQEFRATLWPAETFVDFEHGLNSAVKRLRHILDDDSDHPRFIETLPRHGYRFIGAVRALEPASGSLISIRGRSLADAEQLSWRVEPKETATAWQKTLARGRYPRLWTISVAVLVLIAALVGIYQWRAASLRASSQRRTMLAVLPLVDLSGDHSQRALADGMTEELITQLAKADPGQLGVIAHTSSDQYRYTKKTISAIGKELGVDYMLEGSARTDGNRIRVSVQLIRVSDLTHIWAEEYDGTLNDVLGIQSTIADSVRRSVREKLSEEGLPAPR